MTDDSTRPSARATRRGQQHEAPERIVQGARASLRATEVYGRALSDRFEVAFATDPTQLARIPTDFLLHLIAVSDAFQGAANRALWHIEPELAHSADVVAGLARDGAGQARSDPRADDG